MHLLKNIFSIGILSTDNSTESKRIKALNLVTLISLINVLFFLGFDYFTGTLTEQQLITLSVQLFIYSGILYIHKNRYFKAARFLLLATILINQFYSCNFSFKGYYGEYLYIIVPITSLFFFNKKITHYIFLILSIVLFYAPNFYLNIYPKQYFGYLNTLFLFVGIFFIVKYFKTINEKNERLLELEKNKALNDKVTLEKQKQDLEKLEEFKSHFFVNLSHEIRTPLALIKGYSSRITLKENDTKNYENFKVIKTQTQYIQDIVDDILDLRKLEDGKLSLHKKYVAVSPLIKKVYHNFSELFNVKNISFLDDITIPAMLIHIDYSFFIKSLNNLLHNAYKFTSNEGNVILKATYTTNGLKLSIIDDGIGIPPEDINNIFNRYYQSKNDITKSQGSGIGLSFTKNIIEAHNFELTVQSRPNEKTMFTINIPKEAIKLSNAIELDDDIFELEEAQLYTPITSTTLNKEKKTILIVEDHDEMRSYLKLILSEYNIIEARNGKEGLKILKNNQFDAIITDYMMPVMDGFTFISEAKKQNIKAPIIVITARSDDKGKLDILRLGIDTYITKPFLEEELILNLEKSIFHYNEIKSFKNTIPEKEKLKLNNEETLFNSKLKKLVEDKYNDKNFGVEILAELMNLSRSSLFRKTKLFLGQTPNEIINEVRLIKAKQLIEENPNIKKKELADAVGIYNVNFFYKKLNERFYIIK